MKTGMGRLAAAIWVALFGLLLTFVMGVIVWAVAGPTLAVLIFAGAVILFVWLPARATRTTKRPPHPGG